MKIGGNFMITAMIASLTEGFLFAEAEGIDPAVYLQVVTQDLFQSPFYELYGKLMLEPPATPGGTANSNPPTASSSVPSTALSRPPAVP